MNINQIVIIDLLRAANPPTDLSVASRPSVSRKLTSVSSNHINLKKDTWIYMIKYCSEENGINQKLPVLTVPLSLRQTSANMSCFVSCHCLDLLFQWTINNTQQSAVRARHETKMKKKPQSYNCYSFDGVTAAVAKLLWSAYTAMTNPEQIRN